jgi:hypothetical protein
MGGAGHAGGVRCGDPPSRRNGAGDLGGADLQTPSRSMMVIAAAPDACRYSIARFLFGDLASMAGIDSGISRRRHGKKPWAALLG